MVFNKSNNARQILLLNLLPHIAKAYSSIIREEKQRNVGAAHETTETSPWQFKVMNQ